MPTRLRHETCVHKLRQCGAGGCAAAMLSKRRTLSRRADSLRGIHMPRLTRRQTVLQFAMLALAGTGLEACLRQSAAPAAGPTAAAGGPAAAPAPTVATAPTPVAARPTSPTAAQVAGPPKRGGMLTVGVQNDWVTMDPPN